MFQEYQYTCTRVAQTLSLTEVGLCSTPFFLRVHVCGSNKVKEDWKRSWEQILGSSSHNCWAVSNFYLGTAELAPSETKTTRALPELLPTGVWRIHQVWLCSVYTAFHKTPASSASSNLIQNFRPFSIQPDSHTKTLSLHKKVYRGFPNPWLMPGLGINKLSFGKNPVSLSDLHLNQADITVEERQCGKKRKPQAS